MTTSNIVVSAIKKQGGVAPNSDPFLKTVFADNFPIKSEGQHKRLIFYKTQV